jgi:hypothetical protein
LFQIVIYFRQNIKLCFDTFLSQDCKAASGTAAVADREDATAQIVVLLHGVIYVCSCVFQVSTAGEGNDSVAAVGW